MLKDELSKRGYNCEEIRLSQFLQVLDLKATPPKQNALEYERINCLMNRGNELRQLYNGGEALALLAAAQINSQRPETENSFMSGRAFIFNQLKHPDEVYWLRKIYGTSFHLIGVFCPESIRRNYFKVHYGLSEEQIDNLIKRDEEENDPFGQHLRDTYYLADVFIEITSEISELQESLKQLERYFKLLFCEEIITPTPDEYGIYLAYAASLRSADLSRQVGAAILSNNREVISLGVNEVPAPQGGQYWEDFEDDKRDFKVGYDSNVIIKREALKEVLSVLIGDFKGLSEDDQNSIIDERSKKMGWTRMMNLTEFGRAVHAEMEAILAAGRIGVSVRGFELYTTTFPCHNCAKHIVGAGIKRVVYIEPYPKSLAQTLHNDAIIFSEDQNDNNSEQKTRFEPFVGVGPRMYSNLFSILTPFGRRLKRKGKDGNICIESPQLRISASPLTYINREAAAAVAMARIGQIEKKEEKK
ncbi:MAG: cytidine deaminase [Firmicutes bacterium]|nr:cytidine deaminase [Bacillota bacterium]